MFGQKIHLLCGVWFFSLSSRQKLKTVWQAPPLIQLTCGYFIAITYIEVYDGLYVGTHFSSMVVLLYGMGYFIVCTMISEKSFHSIFRVFSIAYIILYMAGWGYDTKIYIPGPYIKPENFISIWWKREKSTWEVNYMVERYLDVVCTWVK